MKIIYILLLLNLNLYCAEKSEEKRKENNHTLKNNTIDVNVIFMDLKQRADKFSAEEFAKLPKPEFIITIQKPGRFNDIYNAIAEKIGHGDFRITTEPRGGFSCGFNMTRYNVSVQEYVEFHKDALIYLWDNKFTLYAISEDDEDYTGYKVKQHMKVLYKCT